MKKAIVAVLVISAVLGVLFWKYSTNFLKKEDPEGKQTTLIYWGFGEDEAALRPIIAAYQQTHPNVKISYVRQSPINYRTRLQTQLQAGQGPDIFRIHSSWLPLMLGDLSSAPTALVSESEYSQTFYPMAKETLVLGGKIYAFPREVDGIAMYINEDILQAIGAKIPVSWQELIDTARSLTVKNASGQIQTAGVALGTTGNVDFWPETIAMLFLQQPEGSLVNPANKDGAEVLQFYTSFVIDPKNKTWDVTLPSSSQMFASGRLAFYFAPFAKARAFKAENPNLHFKVVPVPQLPGKKVAYGSFWVEAVSGRSANQKAAWEFVKYLSSAPILQSISDIEIQTQDLSRPYPRVDMASLQSADPILGAFVAQAPYYKGWYLNSGALDAGINDEIAKLYQAAVNDVLQGRDSLGALQSIQPGIQQALDKYKAEK